jgi:hypothetical protein
MNLNFKKYSRSELFVYEALRAAHELKQQDNVSNPSDCYGTDPDIGEVVNPDGEIIGNLNDECK